MKMIKPRILMPYFAPKKGERFSAMKKSSDPAVGDYKLSDKGFEKTRSSPRATCLDKAGLKCYTGKVPLSCKQ